MAGSVDVEKSVDLRGAFNRCNFPWYVLPGVKLHGDYWVLDLESFFEKPSATVLRQVKETSDVYLRGFLIAEAKAAAKQIKYWRQMCSHKGIDIEGKEIAVVQTRDAETQCDATASPDAEGICSGARQAVEAIPLGYEWQEGRLTRIQKTSRPPYIRPELWMRCKKWEKEKLTAQYQKELTEAALET